MSVEPSELAGRVRAALRRVIDPELGFNIVDLGLVYDIAAETSGAVRVTMTTTTPGCPATSYIEDGVREAAGSAPGVEAVDVNVTYRPLWTPQMMSPEARRHLGISMAGAS